MESLTAPDRVHSLIREVKEGVAKVQDSADWKRMLEVNSRFWRYSFSNQMLIALQCPKATHVAGFNAWKDLGRWVKKGESGIRILAPMVFKPSEDDENERAVCFKSVCVFDVSQTEGEELLEVVHPLRGEAPGGMFFRLKEFAESQGFTVRFSEMDGSRFGYVTPAREIALRAGVGNAQSCKTLCHEIAHGLLGHLKDCSLSREEQELEAETAAWVVCKNLGLETSDYTFGYLATWVSSDRDAKLERAAGRACQVAKAILEGLEKRTVTA